MHTPFFSNIDCVDPFRNASANYTEGDADPPFRSEEDDQVVHRVMTTIEGPNPYDARQTEYGQSRMNGNVAPRLLIKAGAGREFAPQASKWSHCNLVGPTS
jgi:hypothetical protein